MAISGHELLNSQIAMGIFALYVVVVSAVRLMSDNEFPRLTAMKKLWGRSRGLLIHFLTSVALPMVLGVVFLCEGITDLGEVAPDPFPSTAAIWMHLTASSEEPPAGEIAERSLSDDGSNAFSPSSPIKGRAPATFHWSVPPP